MPPLPTIPLVGGPFAGDRRPVLCDPPDLVERLSPTAEKTVVVYKLESNPDGSQRYVYHGTRPVTIKH